MWRRTKKPLVGMPKIQQEVSHFEFNVRFSPIFARFWRFIGRVL